VEHSRKKFKAKDGDGLNFTHKLKWNENKAFIQNVFAGHLLLASIFALPLHAALWILALFIAMSRRETE
jgi:hypothetical protein